MMPSGPHISTALSTGHSWLRRFCAYKDTLQDGGKRGSNEGGEAQLLERKPFTWPYQNG